MKLPRIRRAGFGQPLSSRMLRVKRSIPREGEHVPRMAGNAHLDPPAWLYGLGGVLLAIALAGWARHRKLI